MSRGANTTAISLPWPPRELSPNARVHYLTRSRVTKAVREQAYWLARMQETPPLGDTGPVIVDMTFYPPDRRKRDLDGMLSSAKAQLDGIADALCVNDNRFEFRIRRGEPRKHGAVIVTVEAA